MNTNLDAWGLLSDTTWRHVALAVLVLALARVLTFVTRWAIQAAAHRAQPRLRLLILRFSPVSRLIIDLAAIAIVVPILVEPTLHNVLILVASAGFAVAFALKDYVSSLVAGLVAVFENTYQPGDWIQVGDQYGEVRVVGLRAVHIVTADDTEIIVPHSRLWSESIANATSGNRSLLCVANFYLAPDHDAVVVRQQLREIGEASSYRKDDTSVTVIVLEEPWGTHYRVKLYAKESREQFLLITDVTVRGKQALRALDLDFALVPFAKTRK